MRVTAAPDEGRNNIKKRPFGGISTAGAKGEWKKPKGRTLHLQLKDATDCLAPAVNTTRQHSGRSTAL